MHLDRLSRRNFLDSATAICAAIHSSKAKNTAGIEVSHADGGADSAPERFHLSGIRGIYTKGRAVLRVWGNAEAENIASFAMIGMHFDLLSRFAAPRQFMLRGATLHPYFTTKAA